MISIRRVLCLIAIILLFVPFALWDGDSFKEGVPSKEATPLMTEVELIQNPQLDLKQGYDFLIVGKDNIIKTNIITLFNKQKLMYSELENAIWQDFSDKDMVIVCEEDISDVVDLEDIEAYISSGGKVLFAGGISENYKDSFLNPILGIENKSIRIKTDKFKIPDDFFVIDEEEMQYNDFNASVWLTLKNAAEVYISDKDLSLPVVFSHSYNKGKALVVNGTLLDNPDNMGIVTALISKGLDTFAYPILGKSLTYLDSISDIAYDDDRTIAQYGVNSSYLILDKLMPELIAMSLRHNIVYTASVQAVSSSAQSILPSDLSTTWKVAKQILKYNGEITYSGNFEDSDYQINTQTIDKFNVMFPDYEPSAFMINSGKHTEEIDKFILSNFPKTSILRYTKSLDTTNIENNLQSYSYGLDLDKGERWTIINNLTSMGLFSHRMDMRMLAGFADDGQSYQDITAKLGSLSSLYEKMSWLEPVTITEAISSVKSYESLEFTQQNTVDGYEINLHNFINSQKFMLYSQNEIKQVTGAKIKAINGNYYILECNKPCVTIVWEDK